ncbi:aristolochene synthase [Fusarium austroafricanum]|uniref:Aristolochene synthase n=1 Tax=Fusarium austroafricanum TaxID=2364996 RepID=A0A8H4K965_9HYPO|nr:aristolochene synthase [Fusarium austroafricanum]
MPHKDLPIRPLADAFDPVGPDTLGVPELDWASLFRKKSYPEDAPLILYPEELNVPWHCSFPYTRQAKWWAEAADAGRELVHGIMLDKANANSIPFELEDERRKWKVDELVEDAVSCCTYLYPTSTPKRLALLTQAVVLLFFHDDVIERGASKDDSTVVDEFLTRAPKNKHLKRFCEEVMECDSFLGLELIDGIYKFVRDGRLKSPFRQDHYKTLAEYFLYRRNDVGKTFMIAAIRFGTGYPSTQEEIAPLDYVTDLWTMHLAVHNDLYSYDKEMYELKNFQASVVNTVYVVEKLLCVNPTLAKNITRDITFDWEKEIYAICEKWTHDPATTEGQRVHLESLFDSMAGNIFHSATLSRYVRHGERPVPTRT